MNYDTHLSVSGVSRQGGSVEENEDMHEYMKEEQEE